MEIRESFFTLASHFKYALDGLRQNKQVNSMWSNAKNLASTMGFWAGVKSYFFTPTKNFSLSPRQRADRPCVKDDFFFTFFLNEYSKTVQSADGVMNYPKKRVHQLQLFHRGGKLKKAACKQEVLSNADIFNGHVYTYRFPLAPFGLLLLRL